MTVKTNVGAEVQKSLFRMAQGKLEATDMMLVGSLLILMACAKRGDTLQESIDKLRAAYSDEELRMAEAALRSSWDALHTMNTGGEPR